jgi:4'-phosphopantetheinyl transferase EntD
MIERILPPRIVVAVDIRGEFQVELAPSEAAAIRRAVDTRRREFTTARACARIALAWLGLTPGPIPPGPAGEPRWPAGVVGSITHCGGYRAAAVGRAGQVGALAIDAEPNQPLPAGVLAAISTPEERLLLRRCQEETAAVCWGRLLFSAKEAVFKLWFPLTGDKLDFEDASVEFDPAGRTFHARLGAGRPGLRGRWLAGEGLLLTGICLSPDQALQCSAISKQAGEPNGDRGKDNRSGERYGGPAGIAEDV